MHTASVLRDVTILEIAIFVELVMHIKVNDMVCVSPSWALVHLNKQNVS